MKKRIAWILFFSFFICLWNIGFALAEADTQRLNFAFGLFSVEIPANSVIGPNTGNELSAFRYEVSAFPYLVYANFAPMAQYADTAQRSMESYISLMFVLCGDEYTETGITEEPPSDGVSLRWQLMRGKARHALWFEAFTDLFGYNVCLYGEPNEKWDRQALAMMRSFKSDPKRELDLLLVRQSKEKDNSFISAEHGLCLPLDADWNAVTVKDMLYPNSAFSLEKDNFE